MPRIAIWSCFVAVVGPVTLAVFLVALPDRENGSPVGTYSGKMKIQDDVYRDVKITLSEDGRYSFCDPKCRYGKYFIDKNFGASDPIYFDEWPEFMSLKMTSEGLIQPNGSFGSIVYNWFSPPQIIRLGEGDYEDWFTMEKPK